VYFGRIQGVLHKALCIKNDVHKGLQWAILNRTVVYTDIHKGPHLDGFGIPILKSIKEFEDVFGRPTNNGSAVVNEHRPLEQVGMGFQECFDVCGSLEPRHDFFSGVL